jgi:hypothetical protein
VGINVTFLEKSDAGIEAVDSGWIEVGVFGILIGAGWSFCDLKNKEKLIASIFKVHYSFELF